MSDEYVPERADLVWLAFNPQAGHEQAGHRPALVVSPRSYNEKSKLALFCPVTNQEKGYPFEVSIPDDLQVSDVILSDQIKSLDWDARDAEYICSLTDEHFQEVLARVQTLIR